MPPHPLQTILFIAPPEFDKEHIVRHWYHVPRLGDLVTLTVPPDTAVAGKVATVLWADKNGADEPDVVIRLVA